MPGNIFKSYSFIPGISPIWGVFGPQLTHGIKKIILCQGITLKIVFILHILQNLFKMQERSKWVFQQVGAPCHASNQSQKWCSDHLDEFLDKNIWPPNLPDLNPLNYFYWNEVLENMEKKVSITTTEMLVEKVRNLGMPKKCQGQGQKLGNFFFKS